MRVLLLGRGEQIHYDNEGRDMDEGIEVVVPADVPLTSVSVVLYNGNTASAATMYSTIKSDTTPPLTLRASNVGGSGLKIVAIDFPKTSSGSIQNGDADGLALVRLPPPPPPPPQNPPNPRRRGGNQSCTGSYQTECAAWRALPSFGIRAA